MGYLIALVAFRIGRLPECLQVAKTDLQGDDEFGFSDFLRMVEALVYFEHASFTDILLDEVERFTEEVPAVETRRTRERLTAVRAIRVAKAASEKSMAQLSEVLAKASGAEEEAPVRDDEQEPRY